jgi:ABC-2 type transport system permease protein
MDRTMTCRQVNSGLESWLKNYGIDIQKTMVLDRQNFPVPVPTRRRVGDFAVEETALAPYPYFVNIRGDGFGSENQITSGINQMILDWTSPIAVDKQKNEHLRVVELLRSSPESWTSNETSVTPDYSEQQPLGFPVGKDMGRKLLAVDVEGPFQSYFTGRKSPWVETPAEKSNAGKAASETTPKAKQDTVISNVIDKSPESARIIVLASNSFLSDKMMFLASAGLGSEYTKPVELIQNAADWSLGDRDLLAIRGRGHFARTLRPMSEGFEMFFEYLNYGLACAGLLLVWLVRRHLWLRTRKRFDQMLGSIPTVPAAQEGKS